MLKTISSRLILIFITVFIIAFSLTGATFYYLLGDFMSDEKVRLLEKSGEELSEFINEYIEEQDNPFAQLNFQRILNIYSLNTGSLIFLVNSNGEIVSTGPEISRMPSDVTSLMKNDSISPTLPDKRQFENLFKDSRIKDIGDFYGLYVNTGYAWITIGLPYKYTRDGADETVVGGILLSTPLPGIEQARVKVLGFYIISMAIAIVVSIIIAYLFSQRITRPIKKIRNAAKAIADGDFEKRLDITARDEIGDLARTFDNMAAALKNLEEMRRGFIANVSHELRTPMTSIKGFIDGILDGTIPADRQRHYLLIVKDEAERLNRLVNDLLDLARIESGELKLNITDFDMNETIRRCVIKLEHLLTSKGIEIEAGFDEEHLYVKADADAIERVVLNLLHNAFKFSPENSRISVSVQAEKSKVIVSVRDYGIGISSEEIDLIWERFYKSDKSRARDKGGTGLGLAIVKNLINEHGQEIWAESTPGAGSAFFFTLLRSQQS